jgi:hypothetical protein
MEIDKKDRKFDKVAETLISLVLVEWRVSDSQVQR